MLRLCNRKTGKRQIELMPIKYSFEPSVIDIKPNKKSK
jgi:hypothetical protein